MVGFEGIPIISKNGGSVQPSIRIVSLPTSNHPSFTWKRIYKENVMELPLASRREEYNLQSQTNHFREEKEWAFGAGIFKSSGRKPPASVKRHAWALWPKLPIRRNSKTPFFFGPNKNARRRRSSLDGG